MPEDAGPISIHLFKNRHRSWRNVEKDSFQDIVKAVSKHFGNDIDFFGAFWFSNFHFTKFCKGLLSLFVFSLMVKLCLSINVDDV